MNIKYPSNFVSTSIVYIDHRVTSEYVNIKIHKALYILQWNLNDGAGSLNLGYYITGFHDVQLVRINSGIVCST